MTTGTYAVVWMDAEEARIIFVNSGNAGADGPNRDSVRLYHRSKSASPQARRATDEHVFYQKVANDLASVRKFLVLGPADARVQFVKHLRRYDPRLIGHLSAVDSMTDGGFLAIAQAHFQRVHGPAGQAEPTVPI